MKAGSPPYMRLNGQLGRPRSTPSSPAIESAWPGDCSPAPAEEFAATGETDLAHSVPGPRPLPGERVPPARLGGPRHPPGGAGHPAVGPARPAARRWSGCRPKRAAWCSSPAPPARARPRRSPRMIDHINEPRAAHIVTIEDPIEVLHADKQAIVSQREVGTDTVELRRGDAPGARQDPTSMFVGELREAETLSEPRWPPPRRATSCSPPCAPRTAAETVGGAHRAVPAVPAGAGPPLARPGARDGRRPAAARAGRRQGADAGGRDAGEHAEGVRLHRGRRSASRRSTASWPRASTTACRRSTSRCCTSTRTA